MQSNDSRPVKTSGQRRRIRTEPRDFVRNAADQFRKARENTDDDWEDAALRALEAECYRLLTGGFRRASELVDRGDGIETDGGSDRCAGDTERTRIPRTDRCEECEREIVPELVELTGQHELIQQARDADEGFMPITAGKATVRYSCRCGSAEVEFGPGAASAWDIPQGWLWGSDGNSADTDTDRSEEADQ